jgi:hypothetical protein
MRIVFGLLDLREGSQQAEVPAHMEKSSSDTASSMGDVKIALQGLVKEQEKSFGPLVAESGDTRSTRFICLGSERR